MRLTPYGDKSTYLFESYYHNMQQIQVISLNSYIVHITDVDGTKYFRGKDLVAQVESVYSKNTMSEQNT